MRDKEREIACRFLCKDNMSNWVRFSLSPHLRVDEDFGREDQATSFSLMPLLFDGPFCVAEPFKLPFNCAPSTACPLFLSFYWIYENNMDEGRTSEDGSKLEDFLRYYSNSLADETQVHCQQEDHNTNQNHVDKIKYIIVPSFNIDRNIETRKYSLTDHSSLIQSYHFNDNSRTLIPNDNL
ncbi:hypothetical protein SADUNF_Sadunf01G0147300 [Salix dunnii]|uniref:Uncharacterized protein n=1 Tax=Salix dunnii TaxID=1413687 RepID=A0A835TLQ3_9ROSI|nr:hypothetical protein SADUNF_Sadunf01G0147300 [Salix dunnii]